MATVQQIPPGPDVPYTCGCDLLDWMREQFARFGEIYRASIYGTTAYVTRDPDHAEHVLRTNWRKYAKGQAIKRVALLLGNGLMVSEGEFWSHQRRMVQPAFHRQAVAQMFGIISSENLGLLKSWERAARKAEPVNVTVDISRMVLKITALSLFGADCDDIGPYFSILSDNAARSLEFAQAFRSLRRVLLELVIRRRKRNLVSSDILGLLMEARDPVTAESMTDNQIVNETVTLIVAGHETTASTLNWLWYLLSQHASIEERLALELRELASDGRLRFEDLPKFAYARQVIEETLRLYPAGWLMTRRALEEDQLGDYFVPSGTEIYIPTYFIQRHPALWPNPDCFNPDRFGPEHRGVERHRLAMLPFSAGPRNCIGELFARLEMQIHVILFASRLKLRCLEAAPPELDLGVNLRSKSDFVMTPCAYDAERQIRGAGSAA